MACYISRKKIGHFLSNKYPDGGGEIEHSNEIISMFKIKTGHIELHPLILRYVDLHLHVRRLSRNLCMSALHVCFFSLQVKCSDASHAAGIQTSHQFARVSIS